MKSFLPAYKEEGSWIAPSSSATTERALSLPERGTQSTLFVTGSASSSRSISITSPIAPGTFAPAIGDVKIASRSTRLSGLSARDRLKYLAKNQPFEFVATIVSMPGAIYLLTRSLIQLFPAIGAFLSWEAQAQTDAVRKAITASGRDAFDWYVGALMGLCLLAAVGATLFAKNEEKISFGKDTTKTIIGFVIGFLSGGKVS